MTPRVGRTARTIVGALSALTMLVAVSGCGLLGGSDETPAASGAPTPGKLEKTKIKLGLIPVVDVASVHVAIKKGYFQEEGLEIEPVKVQGGAFAIPSLLKGELDITFGNWVSFFAAESKGAARDVDGLKLINDGYQAKPDMFLIVAKADSPIKAPKDLVGKTIAINTFKNIAELTAKATLEANDVDPSKVNFKELPFGDMEAAVQNGSVDAAFMVEPFISKAQRSIGAVTVLDAASGPTDSIPVAGYGTTGKFAKENPNTIAAFQRAMAKGQRDAADRLTVEPLLVEYVKVDKETASLVHFGEFPVTLDPTRLQRVANLMRTYGLLDKDFDVKPMLLPGSGG
ncbi:ABC transporter substrate-binding protein [Saccharothrix violaceirubra]|uniref:NitT/TauT family transport system substrate-binding protein n=1 Tax=Saccharothrix violaceirubra TaxID=413306 RepID=A0A7W7T0M6_9PSEU|nr:ABC transporter substrate-binding protein [Saccharothrix violaceirubra]MBB4964418.1 NitT/TauT family transport system substrate-binding protein [Saccharothrix violaceirubra]